MSSNGLDFESYFIILSISYLILFFLYSSFRNAMTFVFCLMVLATILATVLTILVFLYRGYCAFIRSIRMIVREIRRTCSDIRDWSSLLPANVRCALGEISDKSSLLLRSTATFCFSLMLVAATSIYARISVVVASVCVLISSVYALPSDAVNIYRELNSFWTVPGFVSHQPTPPWCGIYTLIDGIYQVIDEDCWQSWYAASWEYLEIIQFIEEEDQFNPSSKAGRGMIVGERGTLGSLNACKTWRVDDRRIIMT